jgi:hypothetical protein
MQAHRPTGTNDASAFDRQASNILLPLSLYR